MQQPSLFDPPKPEKREPNLDGIRRVIGNTLYTLRRAEVMPWSEPLLARTVKDFTYYSDSLPAPERDDVRAQLEEQVVRLRKISDAA